MYRREDVRVDTSTCGVDRRTWGDLPRGRRAWLRLVGRRLEIGLFGAGPAEVSPQFVIAVGHCVVSSGCRATRVSAPFKYRGAAHVFDGRKRGVDGRTRGVDGRTCMDLPLGRRNWLRLVGRRLEIGFFGAGPAELSPQFVIAVGHCLPPPDVVSCGFRPVSSINYIAACAADAATPVRRKFSANTTGRCANPLKEPSDELFECAPHGVPQAPSTACD